uniref:CSON007096 protein n=1 Tax=Culicoides sonorensis TaxID=179676 RepID=A0A336MVZ6_CULSO
MKREANEKDGVYVLNGFQEAGSIPVNFPIDICLFKVQDRVYAASLHQESSKSNNTVLSIFRRIDRKFHSIFKYNTNNAHYMDCTDGFVAVANYIDENEDTNDAFEHSSPVFHIDHNENIEIVLTFATPYQNSIHFWKYGENVFLTHTLKYPLESSATRNKCPVYMWSHRQFTLIDQIECLNSYHIERFEVDHEMYLAVANFEDNFGKTNTFSVIYKYSHSTQSFQEYQRIETQAADDIRHFEFTYGNVHDDYLIVANAFDVDEYGNKNYETPSVIYKFINGYFVPFQSITFNHVIHLQPVIGKNHEFLLLIACKDKAVQIYQYDGWNFVESSIDYTRSAFGDGVTSMRAYNNFADSTLIAISNVNHKAGDTNLFFPLYTFKNDITQIYNKFSDWVQTTIDRYSEQNLEEIFHVLQKLPKLSDPDITLHGKLELANAVIHRLDTWAVTAPSFILDNDLVARINGMHERIERVKEQIRYLEGILTPGQEHVEVAHKKDKPLPANQIKEENEPEIQQSSTTPTTKGPEIIQQTQIPIEIEEKTTTMKPDPITHPATEPPKIEITQPPHIEVVQAPEPDEEVTEVIEVDHLYIKNKLTFNTINNRPAANMVRTDTSPLNLKKIKVNGEVIINDRLFVSDHIDGVKFVPENLLLKYGNQFFPETVLQVESLKTNRISTPFVNEEPAYLYLDRTLQETVAQGHEPVHYDEVVVDELFVNEMFNGLDIRIFNDMLLKPDVEVQAIDAPVEIETLNAKSVKLLGGTLSGKTNYDIISVKEGTFLIESSVEFTEPVFADTLFITERINNIHVDDGKMDVLFKDVNYTQVVTGAKEFDTVLLLNPIGLQGKINSKSLEKMNPLTTIDDDIILQGDFEINGDVLVKHLMHASDIIGRSSEYSAQRLFRHGLTLDTTHSDKYFTFTQPIRIDEINTKPSATFNPDDFVKTGTDEIQYITGHKTFTSDLIVKNGFCEAGQINKINLDEFDKSVLKKNGDQVISGRIHLKKLTTPAINSKETVFGDCKFEDILTLDSDQIISVPVTIESDVRVVNNIEARNLVSDGEFAEGNLHYLLHDTVLRDGQEYHITGEKTFENVVIDDLKFTLSAGKLNGINMDTLVWDLDIFSDKYIHINDSLYQSKPLKIKHLHVLGAINGVNAGDFGKAWLLSEGEQEITGSLTAENVVFENGLQLNGLLNGYDLNYFYENTIWLDKDEVLGDVKAIAVTAVDPVTVQGLVSGIDIRNNVLLKNSTHPQDLGSLTTNSLEVKNDFVIHETLNGLNYQKLIEFTSNTTPMNVKILGVTNFLTQPVFKTINGIDIDELYEHAWLSHRNVVLKGTYHIDYAEFTHNIISTGLVNDLDLDYISKNYFSLSKPQDIPGDFYFQNGTIFEHLKVDAVKLDGKIRGLNEKDLYLDINYFDKYALKKGIEQEITEVWEIYQLDIDGDLEDITINDYNFNDDVVRYDVPHNNITGDKFFHDLYIKNVICAPPCLIQDTDMTEWFANAALIYGDFTIQGKTSMENVTVFGELVSFGPVNGKTFDKNTILLKDANQTIEGNVYIKTKYPEENRIVPVFIGNLMVNEVNGRNLEELLETTVYRDGRPSGSVNNLEFYEPLTVHNLHTNGHNVFGVELQQKITDYESYGDVSSYEKDFKMLENVGSYLQTSLKSSGKYLSHLTLRKGIEGAFSDILPLKLLPGVQHIAAFDRDDLSFSIQFYRFNDNEDKFVVDHEMPPLKSSESGERILNVETVHLHKMDYLVLETKDSLSGEFIQTSLGYFEDDGFQRIWRLNTTHSTKTTSLRLNNMDCLIRFSELIGNTEIACMGRNGLFLYQKLEGAPISQVAIFDQGHNTKSNSIVILTSDGNVVVYDPHSINNHDKLSLKQILQPLNPSYIQVVTFDQYQYIAVCSDKTENAAHYGSIEIYRAKMGSEFSHFQTINIKIPVKVEFSKLESRDLLMYVLTNNPSQSIIVYQYTGAAGFKEFISSSTIPKGKGMSVIKMPDHQREFLAIITEKDVMFVEPILKN